MNQEVTLADPPAPEPVATAAPVSEVPTPEAEQPVAPAKTFTQEELDAAIGKRLAREQRKWEREHQTVAAAPPVEIAPVDTFETVEAYAEELATKKLAQREEIKQQQAVLEQYQEREESARTKYDDFDQVAYNPELKISQVMAQTIQQSDVGPDVAYYLGTNPKEAERISKLLPFAQAKELGKIEAKIASNPPVKKVSNAPAPFAPVSSNSLGAAPAYDTTDPRSVASMSTSEWIAAERLRQEKKWLAQRGR